MMTSSRPYDIGGSFASRRGHANQLSISDPSHHVTEAIGTLYRGDDDCGARSNGAPVLTDPVYDDDRPGRREQLHHEQRNPSEVLRPLRLATEPPHGATDNTKDGNRQGHGDTRERLGISRRTSILPSPLQAKRNSSFIEGSPQPSSLNLMQADRSGSEFAMTNIDNPNDIALELSNLQALRRLSMDVGNNTDPDLMPFSGMSLVAMPPIAPTGDDDEADPSRLLWVPARVHPELEPTAFRDFLENRVQTMRRRSGESLVPFDGLDGNGTGMGSLRRRKSMLSRQVDRDDGYVDGVGKLPRKSSLSEYQTPELSLNELVQDPTKVVQKLANDAQTEGDGLILAVAPGMGLRRSTNTTYRKSGTVRGTVRASNRVAYAKRTEPSRNFQKDIPDVPALPSPEFLADETADNALTRVQSEPVTGNFSRPGRAVRRQDILSNGTSAGLDGPAANVDAREVDPSGATLQHEVPVRESSATLRISPTPVPQIVKTPPHETTSQEALIPPRRTSSQQSRQQQFPPERPPRDGPLPRSNKWPPPAGPSLPQQPSVSREEQPSSHSSNPLKAISYPTALPGSSTTTTDGLTFVPTYSALEDIQPRKHRDKDVDAESLPSSKSSSGWKWFKSDDKEKKKREREKEKEKGKEREREQKEKDEQAKRVKGKTQADKAHDNARLDVIQNSIEASVPKGRESLLIDREYADSKSQEERRREGGRKSGDGKKEKDGFFGGLFGGSRKKSDKDPGHKKKDTLRPLTPELPPRPLRADIDFPWTRFPLIEERAIYRMAHIKLANPRRPLHSQVLLSNFMYSYLAKVQAMHPQMQVPISPQQKRLEEERKRREAEQAQIEMERQITEHQAQEGNFNFEYHRSGDSQHGNSADRHLASVSYIDEAQIYEHDHGEEQYDDQGYALQTNGGYYGDTYGQDTHQQQANNQGHYYGRDNRHADEDEDDEQRSMW